jgi:hypothetical protein
MTMLVFGCFDISIYDERIRRIGFDILWGGTYTISPIASLFMRTLAPT